MELILASNTAEVVSNKYLLVDSDFLGELYGNYSFLEKLQSIAINSNLMLDNMVAFEFLRDVFDPKIAESKAKFLDQEIFNRTNNHPENFEKIQENALLLSKIYAHNGKSKGVSTTDLYLAARIMTLPINSLLITGNKKDYPSCIFSLKTIISFENKEGTLVNYSFLEFDRNHFDKTYTNLKKIKKD
ncbi:MAG: hypothetical protein WC784_02940 [Candidatus Shapirobacteria bacterium]|jgi:hypothetical protein